MGRNGRESDKVYKDWNRLEFGRIKKSYPATCDTCGAKEHVALKCQSASNGDEKKTSTAPAAAPVVAPALAA